MITICSIVRSETALCLRRLGRKYFNSDTSLYSSLAAVKAESFLNGANANFLEAQYVEWARNRGATDRSWDSFYESVGMGALQIDSNDDDVTCVNAPGGRNRRESCSRETIQSHLAVQNLIRSYQARGHLIAKVDPLGITLAGSVRGGGPSFDTKGFECSLVARELGSSLREEHMDKEFELPERTHIGGNDKKLTLREIIARLEAAYCNHIGSEYMHINNIDGLNWIREQLETPGVLDKTVDEKKLIMRRITKATLLERYFATKWPAEKRFGLEGGESLIPMMEEIVDRATELGIESIIIGMPHRGRLNVLVNVCRKPLSQIFAQFKPMEPKEEGSGDIKYHLGTYINRLIRKTNKYIKVSLCPNPSHLEVVSPVVQGKTKAEQFQRGDIWGKKVMAILLHGDAAFAGQGVVYESLHMSDLPNFTTHGTIHIVVNNQIGYTTDPRFQRSSPYCTDIARCVEAPVFHVNGDDPEAVAHVARMAIEYRHKFRKDVILDLVCYRRFGHSEEDEPMFTQPHMYTKIRSMKPIYDLYGDKLKREGTVSDADIKMWEKEYTDTLNKHFELAKKETKLSIMDWIDSPWTGFFEARDPNKIKETGIPQITLDRISQHFCKIPDQHQFACHKGILRMLAARDKMVKAGVADWAMGEALAYGSLLRDKVHIRFTGQDVERGTMAHRHHVYHDQKVDGSTYNVLSTLYPDQAMYSLHNSSLSEYGILGFEAGYSFSSPFFLTIWEAQYGDFADTAQAMFDCFISNAESKWICQSGLVIQLPHGIDGAGPEHSSGRVERYLQQCDDDTTTVPDLAADDFVLKQLKKANWIVANVTTPANYFHLIRRQIALPFRKPLVLMTPKLGLKHVAYRSPFKDFLMGTAFQRCIKESGPASSCPSGVKKLIYCSGKVSIIVDEVRKEEKLEEQIAVCRIEQLYPFPYDLVLQEFCKYKQASVWVLQEEHLNQGPWYFFKIRMENLFEKKVGVISRPSSAASATGIKWVNQKELANLKKAIKDLGGPPCAQPAAPACGS